ncbi:HD family phosphohydrolase [Abyssisolibacter fermentans]|uniref:HD family phosphohydrolase n=1 Tax=Abyssisolibacter fermentans TaxID=1766203 RepID=UPI00082DD968|nr:HDIG domain-containing metalloprotein [Abyssisolibacter fermentans]
MLYKKHKFLKKIQNTKVLEFVRKKSFRQIILFVCFTILLATIFMFNVTSNKISAQIGDIANEDIKTTRDIIDAIETNRLRENAMDKVEPIYKFDLSIQVNVKTKIKNFFNLINMVNETINENTLLKIQILKQETGIELDDDDFYVLINTKKSELEKFQSYIIDIVFQVMAKGIKENELDISKENVVENFENIKDLNANLKKIGRKVIVNYIEPNMFLDVKQTQKAKENVADQIENVVIKQGQVIIGKGEVIEQRHIELIRETGLLKVKGTVEYKAKAGLLIFVLIIVSGFIAYLYLLNKNIFNSPKLLSLLIIVILVTLILGKSIYGISPYIVPIATASMLLTILLNEKVSIFVNLIIAISLAYITNADMNTLVLYIVGGLVGSIGGREANHRYKIFFIGLLVGVVNVFMSIAMGLIADATAYMIFIQSAIGLFNGLLCSILTIGTLPLWESMFGIVTPQKLVDLSNPNTPLLKKLLLEAPGTYNHSIIVGNLSEAAAEAVGANPLLARVGAYYHDIGKLKRPYFFKENQFNAANPHDKIKANLSAIIILNHVKDGVELAKKYKLPKFIEDIIRQHHGNTLVAYFYHKAINDENNQYVREESFRYPGPKPQTKEAAIIMLADSVEAAVRSIQEPTKGKIEGLVRKIIKSKLEDGQLDESTLTFKDLDTIANKFLIILLGIFHERIEYPKLDLNEIKGGI